MPPTPDVIGERVEHPAALTGARAAPAPRAVSDRARALVRRGGWPAACLALAALSLLIPYTLDYDPWNWVIWGRDLTRGYLNLHGGTAFKPLPTALTTVFALSGPAAPALWLITARAGGLLAIVLTVRVAHRLGGWVAAVVALVALGLIAAGLQYWWLGESEGLQAALLLAAVDRHLAGRRPAALLALAGVALLRPEAWALLVVYALFVARADARLRRLAGALVALVPLLWIVPPWIATGNPFSASARALTSHDAQLIQSKAHPGLEVLRRADTLLWHPALAAALLAGAIALWRRQRIVLALWGGALLWLGIVAVMAELGYPGVRRFVVPAAALVCVLAGLGASGLARLIGPRRGPVLVLGALALALAVHAQGARTRIRGDVATVREQVTLAHDLRSAVRRVGGRARVLACGRPKTDPIRVPFLTWLLDPPGGVGYTVRNTDGVVVFQFLATETRPLPVLPRRGDALRPVLLQGRWRVFANCLDGQALAALG